MAGAHLSIMSSPASRLSIRGLLVSWALTACSAVAADNTASVVVMRGGEIGSWSDSNPTGVVVMRPARGSFLRETRRLLAKAEAREERLALQNRGLEFAEALYALQATAYATSGMYSDNWWPVFLPFQGSRPPPPSRPRPPAAMPKP